MVLQFGRGCIGSAGDARPYIPVRICGDGSPYPGDPSTPARDRHASANACGHSPPNVDCGSFPSADYQSHDHTPGTFLDGTAYCAG